MVKFTDAFDAWLGALSALGFDAMAHMNPPATDAEITAAENALGMTLPDDVRVLYRIGNGQIDPWRITDPAPGTTVIPLFGSYYFLSLDQMLSEYGCWKDIRDVAGENFDDDYNDTVLRPGDPPVRASYWHPGWVPFSADGSGNSYAVDLSPPEGGMAGQVIVFGADESVRKVLAPSLGAFLSDAAAEGISNPKPRTPPLVTFHMER